MGYQSICVWTNLHYYMTGAEAEDAETDDRAGSAAAPNRIALFLRGPVANSGRETAGAARQPTPGSRPGLA